MELLPHIISSLLAPRFRAVEEFCRRPHEVQHGQLKYLLSKAEGTEFGQHHLFSQVADYEDFRRSVPIREYGELLPWVERARSGERGVLWPGMTRWFARSSGTTAGKSKYIPVTDDSLRDSHLRGPRDCVAFNVRKFPDTRVYGGKTLTLGGSRRIEGEGAILTGDLSAIMIENTPWYVGGRRVPSLETALIADFSEKVEAICRECSGQDVRSIVGVPSWNLVMLRRMLEYTGKANLLEVWPRLELFIHGGVNFAPYRDIYRELIPSDGMHYLETYNASEGFFAIADGFGDDMLLMLDYGTFYEFLPLDDLGDHSKAVPLEGVRTGVNYGVVISSSNGLWRYLIGDVVRFTSLDPYRIRISGRTRQYINAFGEELIVDNVEQAVRRACEATGAEVVEYTVAPIYMGLDRRGGHQWLVEFEREPASMEKFVGVLDEALMEQNSDYEAKRATTLAQPLVSVVPRGTFLRWMGARGKVGGQNKVPRLANTREYVDEILRLCT